MNWGSAFAWGLVATTVLTVLEAGGRGLGLTRMNIPFMLGTMVTHNRERAPVWGLLIHALNGWALAFLYALLFEVSGRATWWGGLLLGLLHGAFVLVVLMPVLPHLHRNMASDTQGPEPTPLLEPPGFLALNYGHMTMLVTMLAHASYGVILGASYEVVGR